MKYPVEFACEKAFSADLLNRELRKWEASSEVRDLLPPYFRARVCYMILMQSEINGVPVADYSVPTEIFAAWKKEIVRDGLGANIEIPDDVKMRKIFSRRTRFITHSWEKQGHAHHTDGLSLLERIYMVYRRLED